jgi:hypothetical protein
MKKAILPRTRSRGWFVAIAIAALAAVSVMWSMRDRSPAGKAPVVLERAETRIPSFGLTAGIAGDTPPRPPEGETAAQVTVTVSDGVDDPASRAAAAAKLDDTIQSYRATMVYPLWSRPADGSNQYLTHWNHPISVGQPFAVDGARREVSASASIDRVFAAPGAAVVVQVIASYVADGMPAPLDEVDAQLQWHDRQVNEWVTLQAVPLQRGANAWAGAVVPSQIAALRGAVRETRIVAFARVGEFSREFTLDFAYAIDLPVVVHGIASDRLVDGQLELDLDVDLAAVAPVGLTATLFASDGTTAIAVFDDRYFPVHAGRQVIPVRFFGKILHDRKIDGPYRLGAVHGYVYRRELAPDQLLFDRTDMPAMTTAAYSASGFSAAGFHSPETDAQLARYQRLRAALTEGRDPALP